MKKFTCLLLIALAISSTYTACANNAAHSFLQRLAAVDASSVTTTPPTADSTVCASEAASCCVITNTKAIIKTEIDQVRATIVAFGTGASKIGSVWAKINALVNASTITGTTTPAAALEASTESGATGAQWKAFSAYTPATFGTDFDNFKAQAPTCFDYYVAAIKKIACDGCKDATNVPAQWAGTTIMLKQASFNAWAAACNKVWYFMWKTGWFVQSVAILNGKKGTFTYTAPAAADVYFSQSAVTIDNINTAFASCYPDAATTVTACTDAMRVQLVRAFVQIYGTSTLNIGRGTTDLIAGTTSFASNGVVARRMLAAIDGSITLDTTNGLDLTAMTATYPPTTEVTLAAADTTAWSTGYVSTTSSSSSSSTTTKNAKVVIGTILSALFAIAFLN